MKVHKPRLNVNKVIVENLQINLKKTLPNPYTFWSNKILILMDHTLDSGSHDNTFLESPRELI